MPYVSRRKYGYRKRRYGYRSRNQVRMQKDISYIKSLINTEMHHTEYTATSNITNTGSVTSLSTVAVDDTNNGRTGSKILPRYLNVNGSLAGPLGGGWVRMIIFMWKDDTPPTVTDVLQSADVNSFLNENIIGSKNDDRKLQVLRDRKYALVQATESELRSIKIRIPFNGPKIKRKVHIKYIDDNSTDVPIYNGIYMLTLCSQSSPASFTYNARLSFYDN